MDHSFDTELLIPAIEARPAIWESRVASYADKVEKIGAGEVCVQMCFQILRRKHWRKEMNWVRNKCVIYCILHNTNDYLR
jgi:hypothetical protein